MQRCFRSCKAIHIPKTSYVNIYISIYNYLLHASQFSAMRANLTPRDSFIMRGRLGDAIKPSISKFDLYKISRRMSQLVHSTCTLEAQRKRFSVVFLFFPSSCSCGGEQYHLGTYTAQSERKYSKSRSFMFRSRVHAVMLVNKTCISLTLASCHFDCCLRPFMTAASILSLEPDLISFR